jgi:hypothetical protein
MSTDSSAGPLREIMDQSQQASTDPVFGQRTLDLGSIYPNPTTTSSSPLSSSISSIPNYTPPAQSGPAPTTASLPTPQPTQPQGFGGVSGQNGSASSVIAPVSTASSASQPIPDIVGSAFNPNNTQIDNGSLVSGPDYPTVLSGSSFLGGQGLSDGSDYSYTA